MAEAVKPPLSQTARSRGGTGCLYAAMALFAAAGLAFFIPFFALPAARAIASRGWDEVPCTILESGVGVHDSSEGSDTYSVDVVYEYAHGGRTYRSDRYNFFGGSSSGYEGKQEVVARLPAGTRTVCWVDPAEPTMAVIERSVFPWIFIGCFPLIFVAVGVGGIAGVALGGRRKRRTAAAGRRPMSDGAVAAELGVTAKAPAGLAEAGLEAWAPAGPVVVEAGEKRFGKLIGLTLAAIFWNGIVGLFVWAMYRDGELTGLSCPALFMIPFVLVGIALLVSVPHQLLAQWNPRPVIDLSRVLHPGARVTVGWRFRGAASRLRRLRIEVEGREEATYRRGTTTTTDKRVFATIPVVDTTHPMQITQGSAVLELPGDTMHSFAAAHNRIVWELKVHGDIGFWPDVADTVPLLVYPQEMT